MTEGRIDWTAFALSLQLGGLTVLILLPLALVTARLLAYRRFPGRGLLEALLALPLVLPPTVLGYYLLVALGAESWIGQWLQQLTGQGLVFRFPGLVLASVLINVPFAVLPLQRSFEQIDGELRDAAACCGLGRWRQFGTIELPLVWPGLMTAVLLTFAHTLGEFGVVLMVGGNIPGETRTLALAIYDRVQAFDLVSAGAMSLLLLVFSATVLGVAAALGQRGRALHGSDHAR